MSIINLKRHGCLLLIRCVSFLFLIVLLRGMAAADTAEIRTFLTENCLACHNADENSGGLDLSSLPLSFDTEPTLSTWIKIHDRVEQGEMPPESNLSVDELAPISDSLRTAIVAAVDKQQSAGRTVLRRLNRREFENSLHQLLGVKTAIQHLLPEDGEVQGFDTVARGLRISAVQMEKYLEVIDLALDDAVRLTERPKEIKKRFRYHDERDIRKNLDTPEGQVDPSSGDRHRHLFRELDNAIVFISHGYSPDHLRQFVPSVSGNYRIRVSAYSIDPGAQPIALKVYATDWKSSRLLGYFDLKPDVARTVEMTVRLDHREHLRFAAEGIGVDGDGKNAWNVDSVRDWKVPGMALEWVEVEGPLLNAWPPRSIESLFGADAIRKLKGKGDWTEQGRIAYELSSKNPKAAARKSVTRFAERAFRRPLQAGAADQFINLADAAIDSGHSYEDAIRVAIRGILVSPRFLMLDESPGRLDDYAIASRLSYFFWSSPPDEELLRLAAQGKLGDDRVIRQQVERMLNAPLADQFVVSFAGQWLDIENIDATTPDKSLYPEYDELLRSSMIQESEAFFRELLIHNLPISNIVASDFVMLDRRLAEHYDLVEQFEESQEERFGEQFRRVTLPVDSVRGGVLTQAAVLKVTANGTVTSPVMRGSWVLRQLLDKPPSPPPPVNAIEPDTRGATTIREQLAKHRDSDTCNRCHKEIDPPGFALESFDVIGGFRERYRSVGAGDRPKKKLRGRNIWQYKLGQPVDCSGQTSNGDEFEGIHEFKQLILRDEEQIVRGLTNKLVAYSTGATISFSDREEVERIVTGVIDQGAGLRTLIHEVVLSKLFLHK